MALLNADQEIFLEAPPRNGEGLLSFSRRLCGTTRTASQIAAVNEQPRKLLRGVRYRIPFGLLSGGHQVEVARALFAGDRAVPAGWQHRVPKEARPGPERLWHISAWFTGRGENYRAIRAANELVDDDLAPGQTVLIPAALLRPAFRAVLPKESPYHLEYGRDGVGDYAVYRLKAGEALYSSVVIRFTGRVFADDVNAVATELAERSGIRDVTDIPVGYQVKIPFDLLLPEFLPEGNERRREWEAGLLASARYSNPVTATRLQGVTVVLDAGHGGADVGTSNAGVWESLHVYDIMVRTKHLLEGETAARVIATTMDGSSYRVVDLDRLPYSKAHRVLTTPNYRIDDSTVGVHLRWYLANSVYRQALEREQDPAKVVFISIHADSLHPSLRGAMAYLPGARYRAGSYGKTGPVYASRREVNERPRVSFSNSDRVKSEGLSRDLAQHLLDSFADNDLAIHGFKPIRDRIIRSRRAWVPAVLRYNAIPAKILLEVCNLSNPEDRRLMQTRRFRQQVAEAIVQGIVAYYGIRPEAPGVQVAARAP